MRVERNSENASSTCVVVNEISIHVVQSSASSYGKPRWQVLQETNAKSLWMPVTREELLLQPEGSNKHSNTLLQDRHTVRHTPHFISRVS